MSLPRDGERAVAPGCTVPYHHKSGSGLGGPANMRHAAGTSDVPKEREGAYSDEKSTGTHEDRTTENFHDEG